MFEIVILQGLLTREFDIVELTVKSVKNAFREFLKVNAMARILLGVKYRLICQDKLLTCYENIQENVYSCFNLAYRVTQISKLREVAKRST